MTIFVRVTKQLESALQSHTKPAIFGLLLLAGCSTSNVTQLTDPSAQGAVCNSETDTFCVENDQQKAARLNRQGLEFAAKQDYDQALKMFKQAIELDSNSPEYYYHLGLAYSFTGELAKEEAAYLAALAIPPAASTGSHLRLVLANVHYSLACLYAIQGKKDQAFEQLEKLATLGASQIYSSAQNDKDLDSLRDDPRFKTALDKIANSGKSPELGAQPAH